MSSRTSPLAVTDATKRTLRNIAGAIARQVAIEDHAADVERQGNTRCVAASTAVTQANYKTLAR